MVGAGIAGLSTAIALRSKGVGVDVVELHDAVDGAAIGLTSRAVNALAELGVLDECRTEGNALATPVLTNLYKATGAPLTTSGPPPAPRADGLPAAVVIHRPTLSRILADAAERAGARIRRAMTVWTIDQDTDAVAVRFSDGTTASYDVVVGADGIRSRVRNLLWGKDITPTYTGYMSLRWTVEGVAPGQSGLYYGGRDLVAVGLLPGRRTYLGTGVRMDDVEVSPDQARMLLREVLDRFSAPYLRQLRGRLDDFQYVVAKPYEWLWLPGDWYRGRVVLIGDAVHATTALLPSGGALAVEDGVVLAQELTTAPDPTTGLHAFVQRRRERARAVVDASVELLCIQERGADRQETARVRSHALEVLARPY